MEDCHVSTGGCPNEKDLAGITRHDTECSERKTDTDPERVQVEIQVPLAPTELKLAGLPQATVSSSYPL